MVLKLINGTEIKPGTNVIVDGAPCTVKSIDISKTGKHGHAKVRFECVGIIDGKKRVEMKPGHERFEVPMIEKRKGQVLSVSGERASVMDLESFETLDLPIAEDVIQDVKDGVDVEYWDVEGQKIIKRKA
jgi:translation initiation factor 5A